MIFSSSQQFRNAFREAGVLFCVFVVLALPSIVAHLARVKAEHWHRATGNGRHAIRWLVDRPGTQDCPSLVKDTQHVHTANTAAAASSSSGYLVNEPLSACRYHPRLLRLA